MLKIRFRFLIIAISIMTGVLSSSGAVDRAPTSKALEKSQIIIGFQLKKNAVKDAQGKIISSFITDASGKKRSLNFGYDSNGLSEVSGKGLSQIKILRSSTNQVIGYLLPDGSKLIRETVRGESTSLILPNDVKVCSLNKTVLYSPVNSVMASADSESCKLAIAKATFALGVAAAVCYNDPFSTECLEASVHAATTVAEAYVECAKAGIRVIRDRYGRPKVNPCQNTMSSAFNKNDFGPLVSFGPESGLADFGDPCGGNFSDPWGDEGVW